MAMEGGALDEALPPPAPAGRAAFAAKALVVEPSRPQAVAEASEDEAASVFHLPARVSVPAGYS